MDKCLEIIRSKDALKLFDWLQGDSILRSSYLVETLRNEVSKQCDVALFFCENAHFMATGSICKMPNLFSDDSLDVLATGLGHGAIHDLSGHSVMPLKDKKTIEGYKFDDFVDVLQMACEKVDPSVAFTATLDTLRHMHTDIDKLLALLDNIIKRCPDAAPRITTATATLSYVYEDCKDIGPYITFLRSMWMMEVNDAHNVSKSSLIALALRIHTSIVVGKAKFEDACSGTRVANLLCCWQSDVWSWIMRICVYSSPSEICALDTTPIDEALCCFRILTDKMSVMPQVYSLQCRASMCLKVAQVLLYNVEGEADDSIYKILTLSEAAVDMLKKSRTYGDFSTSPPGEFLCQLVNCCSIPSNMKRSTNILEFFIHIATEDGRITLFDRILPRCNTDAAMFNCLRVFRAHLMDCAERTTLGTISTLKSISQRITADVHKFNKSSHCVLSWTKAILDVTERGSDTFKLASHLYIHLKGLVSDDTFSLDHLDTP
ncbi:hypothetical protein X943_001763 [Babesia divergens]|uniref:Uncharacterized protein n=1 Tax=Babesia divergens TaxID=32595 RepID=A0AAD9GD13_BABDI|nr:hypothetical protein X943_001763 [Babesia divergens]